MNTPRDNLISELSVHQIETDNTGAITIHGVNGSKKRFPHHAHAVSYILDKSNENSAFLASLWKSVVQMNAGDASPKPSNVGEQRLFVSALKHLANQADDNTTLKRNGASGGLHKLLCRDVTSFSQSFMTRFIGYRIAIDWVTHLVLYDRYRAELVDATKYQSASEGPVQKAAQGYMPGDHSYEEAIPWSIYKGSLRDVRGDQTNPLSEDRDEWDSHRMTSRFSDRFNALVGRHMVGDTDNDPLLPKEGLPTEDQPAEQVYDDKKGGEEGMYLWKDRGINGNLTDETTSGQGNS